MVRGKTKCLTHNLYDGKDHIMVEGIGNNFSWIIEIDADNMFIVSTHYGQHHGEFSTLRKALNSIGWEKCITN